MADASRSDVVSMSVDLTVEDYATFIAYAHQRPELRRRRYASHLRFALVMAAGLLLYSVWRSPEAGATNWALVLPAYGQALALGLAVLAALAGAYEMLLPSLVKRNTRRMLSKQPDPLFLGAHRLDFGPAGIEDVTAQASGRLDWDAVRRVEETPEHLYVILSTLQGVIIPKRGQDVATLEAVRAQLRAHVTDTRFADEPAGVRPAAGSNT